MSDDKYVPDHEMVRECWIDWSAGCGIGRATAYEEFERYIDEIKANALRGYLAAMKDNESADYWSKERFVADIEEWAATWIEGGRACSYCLDRAAEFIDEHGDSICRDCSDPIETSDE